MDIKSRMNSLVYLLPRSPLEVIRGTISYDDKFLDFLDDESLGSLCRILDVPSIYVDRESRINYLNLNFNRFELESAIEKIKK